MERRVALVDLSSLRMPSLGPTSYREEEETCQIVQLDVAGVQIRNGCHTNTG